MRGYVVSDLHMMASYSQADRHWKQIDDAASKADFFVINGDLNEMIFTSLPFEQRMEQSIITLKEFCKKHPKCQFHYVLGNHEAIDAFQVAMVKLAHDLPNLALHDSYFRQGNALYLHGDIPLGGKEVTDSRLLKPAKDAVHPNIVLPFVNHMQSQFRTIRQHVFYRNDGDVKLIMDSLSKSAPKVRDGVKYVFYGHTHHPKFAVSHKESGVELFNTGAGVRNAEFAMLKLDTAPNGDIEKVTPMQREQSVQQGARQQG